MFERRVLDLKTMLGLIKGYHVEGMIGKLSFLSKFSCDEADQQ